MTPNYDKYEKSARKNVDAVLEYSIINHHQLCDCMHIGGNRLRDWPYSQLSDLHDLGSGHMAQRHVAFVNLYLHKFCSNQKTFGGHTDVRTLTPASLRRLRGVDLNMQHVASILLRTGHQTSIHFLERTGATDGR